MRKGLRTLIAGLCTLALTVSAAFAQGVEAQRAAQGPSLATQDTSSGEMVATGQENTEIVSTDPKITRTNKFTLDGKFNYQSLGNDSGKATLTLGTSAKESVVKNTLLPKWAPIAASVFRDQANQLVDLYGYGTDTGSMTQSGFDAYFNMGKGGATDEYEDEVWSCYSLASKLGQTNSSRAGDPGWDQFLITGVRQISKLSDARTMMGQSLYDSQNGKNLSVDEFLGVDEGGGSERLDALNSDDETTGFANVVTAVNCKGASSNFDYVSFGIAFYDFEAVPVAAEKLDYHSGNFKMQTSDNGQNHSVISNGQQQDIMHSATLGDSVTETTSTTLSALASAKMSENIGENLGWSSTEFQADTQGSFNDDEGEDGPGWGESTSGSAETISAGANWGAAWEMAGAAGVEQGHSTSRELSKAVATTVALPPHTAAELSQKSETTTYHQYYNQPVILNYKVAIFATSGDFYSGGGQGGINPGGYDKQSLVIKFDTKEETDTSYGCAATDDLYGRLQNKQMADYDSINGRTYSTHSTASGFTKSTKINWDAVAENAASFYSANVSDVSTQNYFYETPGKLSVSKDKSTSDVGPLYPLFDLSKVTTPNSKYVLYTGNTLDRQSMTVSAFNRFNVPFYGFDSGLGEWNRCDENGTIINEGRLLETDPVELYDLNTLRPKDRTTGGTVYLKWMFESTATPKTGEHLDGQDLAGDQAAGKIESPVVEIEVKDSSLDAPEVHAQGSYSGFWKKQVNLNDVLTNEVTDATDKILEVKPKWESRQPASWGIIVDEGTGSVQFTKPGTYQVRAYVTKNGGNPAYSDWVTITASEHDIVHHEAQDPTCADDGCKDNYQCTDCGKYYTDASASTEVAPEHVLVPALGHVWSDWVTTREATDEAAGEQQRVCSRDESHVETRGLYTVRFEMNGHGTAPDKQVVPGGTSAATPQDPKATGYVFEGWFADPELTVPFEFGAAVQDNAIVYAKWSVAKHTVAIMAVGDVYEVEGETKVDPNVNGTAAIEGGTEVTEDGYTYYVKEVEYGTPVSMVVTPDAGYGLKAIQAVAVGADASFGDPFTPNKVGDTSYSITTPDADVAVVASFAQVTITYDGNAPTGVTVSGVPEPAKIGYGSIPAQPANPTAEGCDFGGWFEDKDCTKPYLFNAPVSADATLYAKWVPAGIEKFNVSYKLFNAEGFTPATYETSYVVEKGGHAYDPTNDIYADAGDNVGYELKKDATTGSTWFTNEDCTAPFSFNEAITADTQLYARVIPKERTVTYYDGDTALNGKSVVPYNTAIGELPFPEPTRPAEAGATFLGWVTKDGTPWSIATNPVTSDMELFTQWNINHYTVMFDTNGYGDAPAAQEVEQASYAKDPGAVQAEGHTFGGWFTDQDCTAGNEFDFADTKIMGNVTLYAKMTADEFTVSFDTKGRGTAPEAQKVAYGETVTKPADPADPEQRRTFAGWYTDAALTKPYDFSTPVKGDLTLYAKWVNANSVVMYRLYNPYSGEHFYTASAYERDVLISIGWNDEGVAWISPEKSDEPVYRLYNPYSGDHHYTMSKAEYDQLVSLGWSGEGIGWYSDEGKGMPVYRQYNPYATVGTHNYTLSKFENDALVAVGWNAEGIGWYGLDEGSI